MPCGDVSFLVMNRPIYTTPTKRSWPSLLRILSPTLLILTSMLASIRLNEGSDMCLSDSATVPPTSLNWCTPVPYSVAPYPYPLIRVVNSFLWTYSPASFCSAFIILHAHSCRTVTSEHIILPCSLLLIIFFKIRGIPRIDKWSSI